MSYEDLEEARVKRAEKEAAKNATGKGKRGRKPKNLAPVAETECETIQGAENGHGRKRKRVPHEEVALETMAKRMHVGVLSQQWVAPIARMI